MSKKLLKGILVGLVLSSCVDNSKGQKIKLWLVDSEANGLITTITSGFKCQGRKIFFANKNYCVVDIKNIEQKYVCAKYHGPDGVSQLFNKLDVLWQK